MRSHPNLVTLATSLLVATLDVLPPAAKAQPVATAASPGTTISHATAATAAPRTTLDSWSGGVCMFARLMARLDPDFDLAADLICGQVMTTEDRR